jgi:hypothetical protein
MSDFEKIDYIFNMMSLFFPTKIKLTVLAENIEESRFTLNAHVKGNFTKDIDYFQDKEKSPIYLSLVTALRVKEYYEVKRLKNGKKTK